MRHEPRQQSGRRGPKHVSIVVFRECDPSIIYGVFDTLWAAGTFCKNPPGEALFAPRIVAAERGPLELITGVSIVLQDSIDDIERTDIVFVPNVIVTTPEELHALDPAHRMIERCIARLRAAAGVATKRLIARATGVPMKKLVIVILLAGAWYAWQEHGWQVTAFIAADGDASRSSETFVAPQSGEQTRGTGVVTRILADDNDGSRHQRFILEVRGGRTLLIAHNIDLAPRVSGLKVGDTVEFYGEYEWNDKGGVIHWTHHDPNGRHVGGWLKHRGRTYQ